MKTVLAVVLALVVPARNQFPMESFASHSVRKQRNLTVKKKKHQLHKQHMHSDHAPKNSEKAHTRRQEEQKQADNIVPGQFCYRRKREINIPFWNATTVLFQEAKFDSTNYSSPSHL